MFHVFAKQQETRCKASGRTVGDSFYRDRAKMRGLILHVLYSESDRSECRMVLYQLVPIFSTRGRFHRRHDFSMDSGVGGRVQEDCNGSSSFILNFISIIITSASPQTIKH